MKNSIVPNIQIRQEKEPTYIYNKYDNLASEDSVMYDLTTTFKWRICFVTHTPSQNTLFYPY